MKKLIITTIVILVIAATAVGGCIYTRKPPVVEISTAAITRGSVVQTVGATGTLEAVRTVKVGTQVTGIISALYADFNHVVRKGQLLAQLDKTVLETQLAQQEANLARGLADLERQKVQLEDARTKLKRTEELFERKIVSTQELEAAQLNAKSLEMQIKSSEAGIVQTKAAVNTAKTNLGYADIYSPLTGIVINRAVDVGQTVVSNQQASVIFDVAEDLTKMQVKASVDESDVGYIRQGQVARFRVDAYPQDEFVGRIAQVRLAPVVQQNVVTYVTVVEVPNPELKLKPGMTTNVTIEIARREDVLRVANGAIRFRPTEEIFAALNQEVPPEMQRRGGNGATASGGGRTGGRGQGEGERGSQAGTAASGAPGGGAVAQGERQQRAGAAPGETSGTDGTRVSRSGRDQSQADPERQARMERFQNMTPEERQQMMQRFAERGGGSGRSAGRGAQPPAVDRSIAGSGNAESIDALFAPLQFAETRGRVWINVNNQLKQIPVRLGISDGTNTELILDQSASLQVGQEVVTAVNIGGAEASQSNVNRSPFMPGGMGRGGPAGGGGRR